MPGRCSPHTERYELRLFDEVLALFDFEVNDLGEAQAVNLEIDDAKRRLLPMNIAAFPDDAELARFVASRRIPRNRAYADEIARACGLSLADTKGIVDATRGVSLNDSYSLVPRDFGKSFSEYNVYDNDLNIALQVIAVSGSVDERAVFGNVPSELSSSGAFPKAWRGEPGRRVLYKAGSALKASNTGREPYAEVLAAQVAKAMGIRHVGYTLDFWSGELCSVCPLFNDKNVSFVAFGHALPQSEFTAMNLGKAFAWMGSYGEDVLEDFKSMLVFDAVVANGDRHMGNYGVLRENATGDVVGLAPVFDNNASLFCNEYDKDLALPFMGEKARGKYGAFTGLLDQCAPSIGARQLDELARLEGFAFERDEVETMTRTLAGKVPGFSDARFDALEGHILSMREKLSATSPKAKTLTHKLEKTTEGDVRAAADNGRAQEAPPPPRAHEKRGDDGTRR